MFTFSRFVLMFAAVVCGSVSVLGLAKTSDFDGDGKTDRVVVRKVQGTGRYGPATWYINRSSDGGLTAVQWGYGEDRPAAADYDGDNKTDIAVWRCDATTNNIGYFYILQSTNGQLRVEQFGSKGDDPSVTADYDGDGKADVAVYRPGTVQQPQGIFYYRPSLAPTTLAAFVWGIRGDEPCPPGDYDADGKADPCIRRGYDNSQATFYILRSQAGFTAVSFGFGTDQMVNADFNGDGRTDIGVIRAVEAPAPNQPIIWHQLNMANGAYSAVQFGTGGEFGDRPVIGDFNGDGSYDVAVWRPTTGTFYVSNGGGYSAAQWGLQNDKLVSGTGYLSKLPVGWNVWYDKLGSGGQGWGFVQQGNFATSYSLPSMLGYNVTANRLGTSTQTNFIRRIEVAGKAVMGDGTTQTDFTNANEFALRVWGATGASFFAQPLNGSIANIGNLSAPTVGSASTPVYVSTSGQNRPYLMGWDNIDIQVPATSNLEVSVQFGTMNPNFDPRIYTSTFGGVGALSRNQTGGNAELAVPVCHRILISE